MRQGHQVDNLVQDTGVVTGDKQLGVSRVWSSCEFCTQLRTLHTGQVLDMTCSCSQENEQFVIMLAYVQTWFEYLQGSTCVSGSEWALCGGSVHLSNAVL